MSETYKICSLISIGALAKGCYCYLPIQKLLIFTEPQQDVLLIQDVIGGTGFDGLGLFASLLLLGLMIQPTQIIMTTTPIPSNPPTALGTTVSPITEKTTIAACVPVPCPNGYVQIQAKCYRYVREVATWVNANQICMTSGARLWEITSAAELTAIRIALHIPFAFITIWTGANDINIEGLAQFTGSNNNFNPSFGNGPYYNGVDNDCVYIELYGPVLWWFFSTCNDLRTYVCESVVVTCP